MRKLASSFRVAAWLGCGLYLGACGPSNLKPTDLTPREQLVQIFDKGQLPSCTLYEELGVVEVESGNFDSSLAKIRRAAAERNATGIFLLTHTIDKKIDRVTGTAMRCLPRN